MLCIHFKQDRDEGVPKKVAKPNFASEHPVYASGYWKVTQEDAARLVGGMVYFHKTKKDRSTFGGRIREFEVAPDGKIVFIFEVTGPLRGKRWSELGQGHVMAWTSGVVEDVDET